MRTPGLYIGSTTTYAGKNTMNIGMGLRFQKEGHNAGYMKPVGAMPIEINGVQGDEDAFYVQDVLGITPARPELVTPVMVTQDFKIRAFNGQLGGQDELLNKIESSYDELSKDRDLMLVAGSGNMFSGRYTGLDAITIVKKLGLKAVVIDRIQHEVNYDTLVTIKDHLGDLMAGVILNSVPATFNTEVESLIRPFLERQGIRVLGVLPSDPLMSSIRTDALAEGLGGRLVAAQRSSERMVSSFLIGTMQVENFMTYFRKSSNAAVIVGGDRADVQLVAIEGNCSCLILTGNLYPNDIILSRADALNVPIIMVRDDTYSVAKKMEQMLGRHKLRDAIKIRQASQIVSENVNFDAIKTALGI